MNQSEEIKSKLDIVDVLGEYISLKAAGSNFRSNCPFHQEKSPSFMVSPDKQIWHCFGCGKGGDIFSFIMEMEGLSFGEAMRQLAPKAGVILQKENTEFNSQKGRLQDVMEVAAEFYQREMFKNEAIKNYLKSRGLSEETVRTWRIGYSPNSWDDLLLYLRSKKYSNEEIFMAGLSIKKEGSASYYNRFRDRVMFPISDAAGNIIAFTARVNPATSSVEAEKLGKYINSPQTNIYDKGRVFFALDKAKMAIKNADLAIIVEGQMDAITCHQFGYKNVIASSGTALTAEQVKLIKRYTHNIALAFDADPAGQMAADRGIKEAMAADLNIEVIMIPGGKDPDECLKNNPADWEKAVENAKPMMEYYFTKAIAGIDLSKIENKRATSKKILTMIAKFSSKLEIDHWLKRLAEMIDIDEGVLRETLREVLRSEVKIEPQRKAPVAVKPSLNSDLWEEKLSLSLLALALKFPEFMEYIVANIDLEQVFGLTVREFYKNMIMYYNDNKNLNYDNLKTYLENQEVSHVSLLNKIVLLADKDFSDLADNQAKNEIIKIIIALKQFFFKQQMHETEKRIAAAEQNKDLAQIPALLSDLKLLSQKIKEIDIN
ncbi:MAG: DNA primase [Candidatus Falkowbacteria bacterium]